VLQSIEDHLRVAVECRLLVLRFKEILKVINVFRPDLLGPEPAVVIKILPDITDDVGLLQEETHGLVEVAALEKSGVAELGLDEQTGKTLTNQTGDVVAVLIVFLDGLHARFVLLSLGAVVRHAVTHLIRDVLDDGLIGGLHVFEFSDDVVELNQQFPILLLRTVTSEVPAILFQEILKVPKERLLGRKGDRGIILDGVQTAKNEIEDTYGEEQFRVKFLDNGAEATAGQIQELEALLLGLGVVLRIALVRGIVPKLPTQTKRLDQKVTELEVVEKHTTG